MFIFSSLFLYLHVFLFLVSVVPRPSLGSRGAVRLPDQLAGGGNARYHSGEDAALDSQKDHRVPRGRREDAYGVHPHQAGSTRTTAGIYVIHGASVSYLSLLHMRYSSMVYTIYPYNCIGYKYIQFILIFVFDTKVHSSFLFFHAVIKSV